MRSKSFSGSEGRAAGPSTTGPSPKCSRLDPGLYLVSVPIGNLADITLRALTVLRDADVVACEDSRVTRRLLSAHGISQRLTAYHEHNAARVRPKLIERLKGGEAVALVSDAGTPLISDPGYKLVRAVVEEDLPVIPIPGPSAVLAALLLSGLPSDRFFFAGFLPPRSGARRRALQELNGIAATLLFFEAPQRLAECLADMAETLGPSREAAVLRELTKLHEEARRGPLSALAEDYAARDLPPKGELVIAVAAAQAAEVPDEEVDRRLVVAMESQSLRNAVDEVAAATGRPRRLVYSRAVALSRDRDA